MEKGRMRIKSWDFVLFWGIFAGFVFLGCSLC